MKRSSFIKISAFAAAAISLPLLNSCKGKAEKTGFSEPVFLSRLFDEATISEVGKAYLKRASAEEDEEKLTQLLSGNGAIARSTDEKAIHAYLDNQIRKEFEEGRTLLVKGWVLAVTEARQCALFSMVTS